MLDAIKYRRSIREYHDKDIPTEVLEEIIEAASMAPSPFNLQPWKFYIVKDKRKKGEIRAIYDLATKKIKCFKKFHLTNVPVYDQNTSFLETATLIIPCYEKGVPCARDSLAMAVENLMIQAASRKIGSVCMARPTTFNKHKRQIKQLVGVEKSYEVPYIIAVGYPSKPYEVCTIPKRKLREAVLEYL